MNEIDFYKVNKKLVRESKEEKSSLKLQSPMRPIHPYLVQWPGSNDEYSLLFLERELTARL